MLKCEQCLDANFVDKTKLLSTFFADVVDEWRGIDQYEISVLFATEKIKPIGLEDSFAATIADVSNGEDCSWKSSAENRQTSVIPNIVSDVLLPRRSPMLDEMARECHRPIWMNRNESRKTIVTLLPRSPSLVRLAEGQQKSAFDVQTRVDTTNIVEHRIARCKAAPASVDRSLQSIVESL